MPDPEQHRSASKSRCYAIVLVLIAFCTPVAGLPAVAFAETGFASYVTPFPAKERYRLIVLGDSLAGGVAIALAADLSPLGVEVTNKAANGLGLARNDTNEWDKAVETLPATDEFQIAVVLFGADDRMAIRGPKLRLDFATAGWKQDYARRVDGLLKALHNRKAAVYWLGLPVMRGDAASNAAQMMNGIFLERVRLNSAKYIDSWDGFVDADGAYSDTGPDMTGNVRQLRLNDGVHMTPSGYQKLASFLEREISHDLSVAKREREVPLAGDETEQRNVRDESLPLASAAVGDASKPGASGKSNRDVAAADGTISLSGENGQAAETVTIVRPPIPGAVINGILASRGEPLADPGHTLPADLFGGFTVLSSIATSVDAQLKLKQQLPLTESPFFKLLIRGDGLPPRAGRADDFTWPLGGAVSAAQSPPASDAASSTDQ